MLSKIGGLALTEGPGGDFDTFGDADLGVTGGDGVELTELYIASNQFSRLLRWGRGRLRL